MKRKLASNSERPSTSRSAAGIDVYNNGYGVKGAKEIIKSERVGEIDEDGKPLPGYWIYYQMDGDWGVVVCHIG